MRIPRTRESRFQMAFGVALVLSLLCATSVSAQVRLQPEVGFSDVYRIRMSTYGGDSPMPLLIVALEYRVTVLDEGQHQIDVYRAERYQPFGKLWLPSITDSVDPSQDDLPENVQLRVIIDRDTPMDELLPDDIPDIVYGLMTELFVILRSQMDVRGVGDLHDVGDVAAISPFAFSMRRGRTNSITRRECLAGEVLLDSMEGGVATLRWRPEIIYWTMLRVRSPNQMSVSEEDREALLHINVQTGAILSSKTTKDIVRTWFLGAVDFATLPALDEIVRPADAQLFVSRRVIELLRLEDFKAQEKLRLEGDASPAGPPMPDSPN